MELAPPTYEQVLHDLEAERKRIAEMTIELDACRERCEGFQRRADRASREKNEAFDRSDKFYERLAAYRVDVLSYKLAIATLLRDGGLTEEQVVAVGIPLDDVS